MAFELSVVPEENKIVLTRIVNNKFTLLVVPVDPKLIRITEVDIKNGTPATSMVESINPDGSFVLYKEFSLNTENLAINKPEETTQEPGTEGAA